MHRPQPGIVDVWRVVLAVDPVQYVTVLDTLESQRLAPRRGEERRRWAVSHGALRRLVAAYEGCAPQEASLVAQEGRSPRAAGGLHLSLSRAGDLALIAVAADPLGVDLEVEREFAEGDLRGLAARTLAPAELARWEAAPTSASLLRSWTRKEATLKALGEGLVGRALTSLDTSGPSADGLTLTDLDVGPGHLAALATADGPVEVRWQTWPQRQA